MPNASHKKNSELFTVDAFVAQIRRRTLALRDQSCVRIGCTAFLALLLWATPAHAEYDATRKVYVRRNIYSLATNSVDLLAYQRGVAAMKALPVTNPLSWQFQANIHGTTTRGPLATNWNKCQHQSYFFVAWHRMYVYYFERIVRSQSGNTNFALPFWDYDIAVQRALPQAFRLPATSANPLYVQQRSTNVNNGRPLRASVTSATNALASVLFIGSYTNDPKCFGGVAIAAPRQFNAYNFTGELENQPHNVVHDAIGGWMGDPLTAGRDPIFWLHHANIDRLWVQWLSQGGGRRNPTNNATWMKTPFTFYDIGGKIVSLTASQILDTARQLDYIYDMPVGEPSFIVAAEPADAATAAAARPFVHLTSAREKGIRLGNGPVTATLPLSPDINSNLLRIFDGAARDEKVLLSLEGITFKRSPGVVYEVYLNVPTNQAVLTPSSVHFVGNLSFFGLRPEDGNGDAGASGNSHILNATKVAKALKSQDLWKDDNLRVTFVPGGIDTGPDNQITIEPGSDPRVGAVRLFRQ